jgi:hypothetical protein
VDHHGIEAHVTTSDCKGIKNSSASSVMCGSDDNALWNGSEKGGNVRSECEEDESTNYQVVTVTLKVKVDRI